MRLIDADAPHMAIALYLAENAYLNDTPQSVLEMVAKWIEEAPTIDAAPIVHARWKMTDSPYCSHCNRIAVMKYRYCPSCGARMDGEAHDSGQ